MPICPYCKQEVIRLYSNLRITLFWRDNICVVDNQDGENVTACSEYYEELGPRDLDKLNVPIEMR
jgi:hypothetical protein